MCLYGNYQEVKVNITSKQNNIVLIDACIADEIIMLNSIGIQTLGCCCSHGEAGQVLEYEDTVGEKWREFQLPAHVLLKKESYQEMKELDYVVYPYYYADGESHDVYIAILKSGCNTLEECKLWHKKKGLSFEKNIGVLS